MTFSLRGNSPAFPIAFQSGITNGVPNIQVCSGISVRDYFAAKAMQTMCAGEGARMVAKRDSRYDESKGNWAEVVALNAYEIADAMLKQQNYEH